jgi:signal transduction histidine kinase
MEEIREEERAAIARELHDELGQVLTGFRMDLSWLLKQLPSERHDLIHKVQFMKSYIDPSIELIRRISTELRSGILDDLGLVATIEWQLQVFRNRTGVDCEFDSHINESELDPKLKTVFFRIIQESITNIVKYAEATSVRISLVQHDSNLNLIIQDNGKGIRQHDLKKKSSTGIRGMKERLFVYNGKLSIKGEPGKGTVLQVMIPSKKGG